MYADNEYGVKKLVCSTVRPTQLPFPELYDMYGCASFLAGYIIYEPLEPPQEPPKVLFSPTETLSSHTGDSFDISMVLCSFLLGAGYDAYVVYGKSPKFIAMRDQRATECPLITPSGKTKTTTSQAAAVSSDSRAGGEAEDSLKPPRDDSGVRHCHAFVMVRAGKRDVKETVFLEPATGRPYSTSTVPLNEIVAAWNHCNYFVNLQNNKKASEVTFDLSDEKAWEYLFITENKSKAVVEEKVEGDTPAGYEISRAFDAPETWVNPLVMDRPRYMLRFPPTGKRCIQYHCAKASFYARGINEQSMTMSIVQYLDVECTIVKEIHEWFENRADQLYKRVRYALNPSRTVEYYHPGSLGGVKTWTEIPGKSIDVEYYVDSRLDRLHKRTEVIGKEIIENFSGRTDCLIYRATTCTIDKTNAASEIYVLKMVQKYEQPKEGKAPAPNTDIAKRVFSVPEGKLITYYHFDPMKVTGKVRTFLQRGPSIPVMSDQALQHELAALERECFAAVKGSVQQMEKVHEYRAEVESNVKVERSVFDLPTSDATISSKVEADVATSDYLTPFLRTVKDINNITKEEALEVRQICLDSCKARLVERANIIQARLNDENAKLGRKQEQFQRSQREGDLSTEEYEKYCTEAMFRIQILEQRLVTHEETALKKFLDLDVRLAADPRLKVLKSSER
eukprot:GSChrysophyteH1.ASY1.ANO1.2523.1 assembled CDS